MITAIVIGAGQRGADVYAAYALANPHEMKIVGVAEANEKRRAEFQALHGIDDAHAFASWEDILSLEKFADAAFICTQDRMHAAPALKAIDLGYHILLEKPMSPVEEELKSMAAAAHQKKVVLAVAYIMRYSAFYGELKRIIQSGEIGELMSIEQTEGVGYFHFAHSFVRGNWRREDETSPIILAKCCHNLDILYWLADSKCRSVASVGSLRYFKKENMPKGAPPYCLDGCPHKQTCPYYAPRTYIGENAPGAHYKRSVTIEGTEAAVMECLKRGPYGRCVFDCDNDVADNQAIAMDFENGVDVSFMMSAFTKECECTVVLMGTHGQVFGNMEDGKISVHHFATDIRRDITLNTPRLGHAGADDLITADFINTVASGEFSKSEATDAVESHYMALAAERSRLEGRVVLMSEFR